MDVGNIKILKGKLVALSEELGGYIIYVFENINSKDNLDKYVMCTRFPNWESPFVQLGETGFVKYKEVEGGIDYWYDNTSGQMIPYKYTGIHFLDFVPDKGNKKEIII